MMNKKSEETNNTSSAMTIDKLPVEILLHIASKLNEHDRNNLKQTTKCFLNICNDILLRKHALLSYYPGFPLKAYTLAFMTELPENSPQLAEAGKIYLSNKGEYVVRDLIGVLRQGKLNRSIDLKKRDSVVTSLSMEANHAVDARYLLNALDKKILAEAPKWEAFLLLSLWYGVYDYTELEKKGFAVPKPTQVIMSAQTYIFNKALQQFEKTPSFHQMMTLNIRRCPQAFLDSLYNNLNRQSVDKNEYLSFIYNACLTNQPLAVVKKLIAAFEEEGKADSALNYVSRHNITPLTCAVLHGRNELVDLLVSKNVALEKRGKDGIKPLAAAAMCGYQDIVETLISEINTKKELTLSGKTDTERTPEVAKDLHAIDLRNRQSSPIIYAIQHYQDHIVSLLIDSCKAQLASLNEAQYYQFMTAIIDTNRLEFVAEFHPEKKVVSNPETSQDLLYYAVSKSNFPLIRQLLTFGYDIDAVDKEGQPPLAVAIQNKDRDCVSFLLNNKASITSERFENQLFVALSNQVSTEIIRILLKTAPNSINEPNQKGQTPVFYLVENNAKILTKQDIKRLKRLLTYSPDLHQICPGVYRAVDYLPETTRANMTVTALAFQKDSGLAVWELIKAGGILTNEQLKVKSQTNVWETLDKKGDIFYQYLTFNKIKQKHPEDKPCELSRRLLKAYVNHPTLRLHTKKNPCEKIIKSALKEAKKGDLQDLFRQIMAGFIGDIKKSSDGEKEYAREVVKEIKRQDKKLYAIVEILVHEFSIEYRQILATLRQPESDESVRLGK